MFSHRLSWTESTNSLSRLLNEKRQAGVRVLDLTESNPTRAGFEYPAAEILAALSDPSSLRYEPSAQGMQTARAAVSAHYAERAIAIDPERLLLTASTSEAYGYLFKLLCDPGDRILTPRPSYPLFEFLAALESVEVRQYPLRYDGAWHIDFQALEALLTPRTKAVVVVNPNNPTGSFLKRDELSRLESLAAANNLAILSDEVFAGYAFADDPSRSPTLIGDRRALTFSMSGLSKIAGLPQMKLGWIAASGPGASDALLRLELIADTYLSVATPVQAALPRILTATVSVQQQVRTRTSANLAALQKRLAGTTATILNVEAGWYAVLQVPRTRSEDEWTLHLLRNHDVLVQPGFFFDFESEAFLVVSLLTPSDTFAAGIELLAQTLAS